MQSMADPTIYSIKGWGVFDTLRCCIHVCAILPAKKSKEKIDSDPAGLCSPWLIRLSILLKGGACVDQAPYQ